MIFYEESDTFYETFFCVHINQYNIDTNLFNAAAADDIFVVSTQYSPHFARTWDNNMCNLTVTNIKHNVADIAKALAVPAINHFFFSKLTNSHIITHIVFGLLYAYFYGKTLITKLDPNNFWGKYAVSF
jgi:hypothetical protein